jgi:outer membrane protein assembly factor BamB
LIGARYDDDQGANSGSAYLFDITTGNLLHKLTAPDGEARDEFGVSVALRDNTALIGASGDRDDGFGSGSAYLFNIPTGSLLQKVTAPDGEAFDKFGWSVTLNSNTALISAYRDDDSGSDSGSAYLFTRETLPEEPESVPEPASILGFLALGAFAAGGALKKKLAV